MLVKEQLGKICDDGAVLHLDHSGGYTNPRVIKLYRIKSTHTNDYILNWGNLIQIRKLYQC